jgi:hypothetical protein
VKGWRIKLISLIIVYFAGFATAIYFLAPAPEHQTNQPIRKGCVYSSLRSDEIVQSFNKGMHQCIDFSKDAAWRMGKYLKQKLEEKELQRDN